MQENCKSKALPIKYLMCLICSIVLVYTSITGSALAADIPAFPGAQGAGQWATGGRSGRVIAVTNLNDSGPGSLRDAINQTGPRIVVFKVSGTIELKSDLTIKWPNITILGQTAPGDGICLKSGQFSISAENVIVRYIRVRLGDRAGEKDAMHISSAKNVIVDHCSVSFSVDETLSVDNSDKVTVQWCIISDSLVNSIHSKGAHGFGSLIRGSNGQTYSYYHNLYAHNSSRNPRPGNYTDAKSDPKGFLLDFRNNVIYDWGYRSGANGDGAAISTYNFVNNYYKKGPSSTADYAFDEQSSASKAYFNGNSMNGVVPSDPWSLVQFNVEDASFDISSYKQDKPFAINGDIPAESAQDAYRKVLDSVGASVKRDSLDTAIINEVKNGTGKLIDKPEDVGGWPELKSSEPPVDSDNDGIPDSWEKAHKLNPNDAADASAVSENGYTNIELYANSIVDKGNSTDVRLYIAAGSAVVVLALLIAVSIMIKNEKKATA